MCMTEPRKSLRFSPLRRDLQELPRGYRFLASFLACLLGMDWVALL